MTYRKFLIVCSALLLTFGARADEGMWLPTQLHEGLAGAMRKHGLRLSADQLYNPDRASINDAIVQFGRGCTGEVISPEGLVLTNHHCGYGQIQYHSTVENDYLKNGFVAMTRHQELPNPGLTVSFMRQMRNVTDQIKAGEDPDSIAARAVAGTHLTAKVEPLYYGGEYYLYVYEVFPDVRLVMTPPEAIGRFGGDTDNWIWPRHTGDFSIFRIYADAEGKPAPYSPMNVPYRPKKYLEISTAGLNADDFTMVYGFPGRTQQFLHSEAVRYIVERGNPEKIALRTIRLEVMNRAAAGNDSIRLMYAAKNANVANAWKKWQGELQGLKAANTVERKLREEVAFEHWAKGKPYEGVTRKLKAVYDSLNALLFARDMYMEGALGSEMLKFLATDQSKRDSTVFFKDYNAAIDDQITAKLFARIAEVLPAEHLPAGFSAQSKPTQELADAFNALLDNEQYARLNKQADSLYRIYVMGKRERSPYKRFYPDANLTLRLAYGHVAGYQSEDGVYMMPHTTVAGIMAKDKPEVYDYNVPERLREIAPHNMGVPVAFLTTTHTTGGNSGSPVLDAQGRLIGVNFDRVWQGTMSDVEFDSAVCRNIALDIRFVLFILEKFAGAQHLVDEMIIHSK